MKWYRRWLFRVRWQLHRWHLWPIQMTAIAPTPERQLRTAMSIPFPNDAPDGPVLAPSGRKPYAVETGDAVEDDRVDGFLFDREGNIRVDSFSFYGKASLYRKETCFTYLGRWLHSIGTRVRYRILRKISRTHESPLSDKDDYEEEDETENDDEEEKE